MRSLTRLELAGGLAIVLLLSLALRLAFVLTPHAVLDADEAIVGLMGRHILAGRFPIFYYGQQYMGTLEPHLAALGFAIAGASPLVLKLVCLAVALVVVWLTAELGRRILGPGPGVIAGLFMALPPLFLTVWSLKARGGFIETLAIGLIVLVLAHRVVDTDGRHRWRAALALGLVAGIGWWTCQLVVSYLAAAAIVIGRGAGWAAGVRLLPAIAGAFFLGSLPMWVRKWLDWPETRFTWDPVDPGTAASQLGEVLTVGLPALLGPGGLWPASDEIEALTLPLLVIYGLAWASLLWVCARAWRRGSNASPATAATLEALFALPVIAVLVCALSPFGRHVSEPRYLLPVVAVLPLLVAALLARLWHSGRRRTAMALGAAIVVANLAGHATAPWTSAREAPQSLEPAVAFLEARHTAVVATSYWIGPRLAFESGERVVGVTLRDIPDRYPPYTAMARRNGRFAYALLRGTTDVDAVERKLHALGVGRDRTSLGDLVLFHNLRLPGLDPLPPGLLFEALERLPRFEARLRLAIAYEAVGRTDPAIRYLEAALDADGPPGSAVIDRLLALYRITGQAGRAGELTARRTKVFAPAEARRVDFGDTVTLLGFTLGRPTVRAGDRLTLVSFWSTRDVLDTDLRLGVQLFGRTSQDPTSVAPVAGPYRSTAWHPEEVVPGRHEIVIPRDFPPGRYALRIRLWDPRDEDADLRPRVGGDGSRWLRLTEIDVGPGDS